MEIGIDSFASNNSKKTSAKTAMKQLIERIVKADEQNLDIFGIGEHHREEFLDSAPSVILAAASSLTKNIKLTSAVSVLSAIDPVRLFQQFATLDIISNGRSEMVVGRGSFSEAFPLFALPKSSEKALSFPPILVLLLLRTAVCITKDGSISYFRPNQNGRIRDQSTGQMVDYFLFCSKTNSTESSCKYNSNLENRYMITFDKFQNMKILKYNKKKNKWNKIDG